MKLKAISFLCRRFLFECLSLPKCEWICLCLCNLNFQLDGSAVSSINTTFTQMQAISFLCRHFLLTQMWDGGGFWRYTIKKRGSSYISLQVTVVSINKKRCIIWGGHLMFGVYSKYHISTAVPCSSVASKRKISCVASQRSFIVA